ncbi:PAS domain S-box protein [Methylomonas sp. SURF-1]|uniref:histidine kinase n=1 Tax=Methylomonas aurea TaxID=2952224 RepID=A0ABT1UGW5_9GAMM|nr:PAS domain S-box protein [Methylomonas sp. SURF-1]
MARNHFIFLATAAYLVFGLAWIFLSDLLLGYIPDIESLVWLSTAKGVLFIVATTGFLYFALNAVPPAAFPDQTQAGLAAAAGRFYDKPRRWPMYLFAAGVTLATLWVRLALPVAFGERPLLVLFMLPVVISALLGGTGPGLSATLLSAAAINYWAMVPLNSLTVASTVDGLQLVIFLISGTVVSWLSGRLQRSLQEAQSTRYMLQAIVDGTSDAVFVKDAQGRYLLANAATCEFVGKALEEIIGNDDLALFPPEIGQVFMANDRAAMLAGKTIMLDEHLENRDGLVLEFQTIKGPILDRNGLPVGMFAVARNVTERKRLMDTIEQQRAALAASEARFRRMYEQSPVAFSTSNREGALISMNREFVKLFGYRLDELPTVQDWRDKVILDPAQRQRLAQIWQRSSEESTDTALTQLELAVRCKDGGIKTVLLGRVRLGDEMLLSALDITQRKRAEDALADSEERLQILIGHAPVALAMFDRDMRYLAASKRWRDDYGLGSRALYGESHYAVFPEIGEELKAVHRRGLAGEVVRNDEDCFRRGDGSMQWLKWEVRPWPARDGSVGGIVIFTEDITARRAAESERYRLSEALRQSAAPNAITAADGTIEFVNPAFLQLFGYAEHEVYGRHPSFLAPDDPEIKAEQRDILRQAVELGGCAREVVRITKDGTIVPVFLTVSSIRDRHGQFIGLMTTLFDLREIKAKEAELAAREIFYRTILDNVPALIGYWDKDLVNVFGNAAYAEWFGIDTATMAGKHVREVLADELYQENLPHIEAVLRGERQVFDKQYPARNGRPARHALVQYLPDVRDGRVCGFYAIVSDVTHLKRAEAELEKHRFHLERLVEARTEEVRQAEQRYRQVVESSAEGIFELDAQGTVRMANPAAARLLGYRTEDFLGRNVHDTIHYRRADRSPCAAADCPLFNAVVGGKVLRLDGEVFWHADGRPIPVSVATHPIRDAERVSGAVMSFYDNTERYLADQAREEARRSAEQLARMKSEFLANMSHEIRTPLNGVLGLAQIGYRDSVGRSETQQIFSRILDSGKLLLTIINDILDLSKIEAGKLEIESVPFDPAFLVDELLQSFAAASAAKGLQLYALKNALPKACLGDPLRVSQILINLVSNAVKFTQAGEICLSAGREQGDLVFSVRDTGIGIAEADQARLFEAFEQADSATTRKFGGTGLGLAISRRLAALMGGTLGVNSGLGRGSTFTLRLPLREIDQSASPAALPRTVGDKRLSGLRILAAEDNAINQMVLEDFLRQEGAEVRMVGNGRLAVEAVQQAPQGFDLVLMDVQMPELDGYEATRQIKLLAPSLPVVGQTAHALKEEHMRCLAAGMAATLTKPLDIEMLVAAILEHTGETAGKQVQPPLAADLDEPIRVPAVDWPALARKFPNQAQFVDRLVRMAVDCHAGDAERLRQAAASGDLTALEQVAHNLKGMAGNICAPELEAISLRVLRSARLGDEHALRQADELIEALQRAIAELNQGRPQ